MTIASKNATLEVARSLMDKALSAPNAVELRFYDDEEGGGVAGQTAAKRWATRIFQARAGMRRLQMSMSGEQTDIVARVFNPPRAVDPESVRTIYDAIFTETRREEEPRPCWVLKIGRATSTGLNLSII